MKKKKSKKISDLTIGFFLVITLSVSAFIVSCSDNDGGLLVGPGNNGSQYGSANIATSALSSIFSGIAAGGEYDIGGDITGWIMGAMGLAGSTPDYTSQLNLILSDLDSIKNLLDVVDDELITINQTLLQISCSEQQTSLQTEIGIIINLYDLYNGMVQTAQGGDTISSSMMQDWVDQVLAENSHAGNTSMGEILSTIQVNVNNQSGALYSCIRTIALPTSNSPGLDTAYYNNVAALTNYYYYYQSIGLMMLSEAYHYKAWVEAGSPTGDSLTADSIQAVCSYNGTALDYCNNVQIKINEIYNSLLTQQTYAGAPYTNDTLIMQYSSTSPVVWVASLEDFTAEAGDNCTYPLSNFNHCGLTATIYDDSLQVTSYRGTEPFSYATSNELDSLFDVEIAKTFRTNGEYLSSFGFKNMSKKTVTASNSVEITFKYANVKTNVVPFFNTDMAVFKNVGNKYSSLILSADDFSTIFSPVDIAHNGCEFTVSTRYGYSSNILHYDSLFTYGFAVVEVCPPGGLLNQYSYPTSFEFCDPTYTTSTATYTPNFVKGHQVNRRFLFPVMHPDEAICTNGRANKNAGGMWTMCNTDFNNYLNAVVPRPGTCDNSIIKPACTTLE